MADKTLQTTIQVRRDTTANWTANKDVVPQAGEPCMDLDTGIVKWGDGKRTYEQLPESGSRATHYEGVKSGDETDQTVIDRVLAAAQATAKKDDIFVVKTAITDDKFSYTAYVYNGSAWAAMDGNYSAENVYFPKDMTFTYAFGKYAPTGGKVSIPASGKNMTGLFADAFSEDLTPKITQPSVSVASSEVKAYEVGTKVTPKFTAAFNPGKYEYDSSTGVTVESWAVTDTNGGSVAAASGSFSEFTVEEDTNYSITAKANHTAGTVPHTALEAEYAAGQIKAGSKQATKGTITGYRNGFYGSLNSKDGAIDSALVRSLSGKSNAAPKKGNTWNVTVPVNALRVVFAYPASLGNVASVKDVNGMNAEIASAFKLSKVTVEGANGYTGIEYNVYVTDMAEPNDKQNTFKVTI